MDGPLVNHHISHHLQRPHYLQLRHASQIGCGEQKQPSLLLHAEQTVQLPIPEGVYFLGRTCHHFEQLSVDGIHPHVGLVEYHQAVQWRVSNEGTAHGLRILEGAEEADEGTGLLLRQVVQRPLKLIDGHVASETDRIESVSFGQV